MDDEKIATKRKHGGKSAQSQKRLKLDDQNIGDILKLVRKNAKRPVIKLTPQMLVDIAKMARANVEQLRASKKGKRSNYHVEARDIRDIAKRVRANRGKMKRKLFNIKQLEGHRRLGYNEYVYDVSIGPANTSTLPDFLNNLREVFNYLINVTRYIASSPTDKARFYISRAPRYVFSTAILNVEDFNVDMFFDIFEKHMQSNAQEIIDDGWQTTISIYIFPNNYVPRRVRQPKKRREHRMYRHLGKNGSEIGMGRKKKSPRNTVAM
jgi:hypothetical protein